MNTPLKLSIEGMHCDGCVRRVTHALKGVAGVEVASVEVGSAELSFDPALTKPDEVAAAVDRIGFQAQPAK